MGYEYKLGGFWLVSVNEIAPEKLRLLGQAKTRARTAVQNALSVVHVVRTLLVNAASPDRTPEDLEVLLHPDFKLYLYKHFRITSAREVGPCLDRLILATSRVSGGLCSPVLRFAEFGYHWLKPSGTGVKGYVTMPFSEMMGTLFGSGGDRCANTDPRAYANDNDVNLKLDTLRAHNVGDMVDTIVHECTHKYLNTADRCVGGIPRLTVDYLDVVKGQPENLTLGGLANLNHAEAMSDAYVLTDFILNMPVIDHTAHARTELAIGLGGNQRVFNSIGNDDL